jgi:adenosylmethionine-8-amino-7-oxononanoate aminotransferase
LHGAPLEILQYEGAHTVAAVLGRSPVRTGRPPDGYLQSIRDLRPARDPLIADEVMAGRTGKWFAVDNWDVVPDILTVARGSTPATCRSARWSREPIADWVATRCAGGLTYSGHPLARLGVASIGCSRTRGSSSSRPPPARSSAPSSRS